MSDRESLEAVADEFWAFSLDLYAHPDVAAACLRLQDEQGLDVNLLLLCCWLARSGRGRLGEGDLAAAEARAEPWRREILGPLRAVRRALKSMSASDAAMLYVEIKRFEILAEREMQRMILAGKLGDGSTSQAPDDDLAANLALYLTRHRRTIDSAADLTRALMTVG